MATFGLFAAKSSKKEMLIEVISALLIVLFSYTGIMKIIDHNNFQGVLSQSGLIGKWAVPISWLIPIVELATALLLFTPYTKFMGFVLSVLLMCLFTGYVFYMIMFMPHLPCNCGGVIKQMSWRQHLVFNVVFTLIAMLGYLMLKEIGRNIKNR